MQIQLGIHLKDLEYADRLCRYVNREQGGLTAVREPDQKADVWLTDDLRFAETCKQPVILSANSDAAGNWKGERINSYLPGPVFYRQIRQTAVRLLGRNHSIEPVKTQQPIPAAPKEAGEGRLLSVYSPIGGCGKSSFAIALSKSLAERYGSRRVLYLNLEEFSDWRTFFRTDGPSNLSDFLYYMLIDNPSCEEAKEYMKNTAVRQRSGVYFIEPCNAFEDLTVLSKTETDHFIDLLCACFDIVVCDMGTSVYEGILLFLQRSSRRYLLVNASPSGQMKLRNYLDVLKRQHFEDLALGDQTTWIRVGEGALRDREQEERCRNLPVQRNLCKETDDLWDFNTDTEWYQKVSRIAEEVAAFAG